MPAKTWRQWLNHAWLTLAGRRGQAAPARPAALRLEELEDRLTPADLVFRAPMPASGTAGQPLNPAIMVAVEEAPGITNPEDFSDVTLTVASGPGGFDPASTTTVLTKGGVATFNNVALDVAGVYTFQATDSEDELISPVSSSVTISPANVFSFNVVASPATVLEGAPDSLTVTAVDPYGNTATGYTGTVQFSSSDARAVLPPDYTFQAADQGSHTFTGVTFGTAGMQTVAATDAPDEVFGMTDPGVTVQPVPQNLQLSLSPAEVQIGQAATLNGSFTDEGASDAIRVVVAWGDGSATTLNLPPQARTFSAAHAYTAEGAYFPSVVVSDADGGTVSGAAEEQVLRAPFQTVLDVTGQPGQTVTGATIDAATGDVIQTTLTLSPTDSGAGEFLSVQFSKVLLSPLPGVLQTFASYDFREHNLGPNDTVVETLVLRGSLDFGTIPVLVYLDPYTNQEQYFHGFFRLVQEPNFLLVTIGFSNTATPRLLDMTQTVFTIAAAVPVGATSAAVSAATASASPTASAPVQTTTFQSTSSLRLTLATTQLSQVSQSVSSLGEGGGGGSDGAPSDDDALAQFVLKQLQSWWQNDGRPLLRLLPPSPPRRTDGPNAPAPAGGQMSTPPTSDAPDGAVPHGLLYPEPHWPFAWTGTATAAAAPPAPEEHAAPAAAPAGVAAAAAGLGLQISKRRKKTRRDGEKR